MAVNVEMNMKIAPMPGFEWCQVSEHKFNAFIDENVLVRQNNGKNLKFYDCEVDAITAVSEVHRLNNEYESEGIMYYIQKPKK